MKVMRVKNNGTVSEAGNCPVAFLTANGYSVPEHIWIGQDDCGHVIKQPTRKECMEAIEHNNQIISNLLPAAHRYSKDELIIEAESLDECGEYLHFDLMGYTAAELRLSALLSDRVKMNNERSQRT